MNLVKKGRSLFALVLAFILATQGMVAWATDAPEPQPIDSSVTTTRSAVIMTADEINPFDDVVKGKYYYSPVLWAVENGITTGKTALTFAPAEPCTRGQIVTFLWRAAGQPKSESTFSSFTDVKPGTYHYNAVLWAVENGITNGLTTTTFGPNQPCTRGQVVTFLWRYASCPEVGGVNNPFVDVKSGTYYTAPVLWAIANNITSGVSANSFAPAQSCTRGEIVTFLYRYLGTGIAPCEHSLREVDAKTPTCTEPGNILYFHCIRCGRNFGDLAALTGLSENDIVISAKGHTAVIDPAVAPTSTQTGLSEGSHCSTCGEVLVPQLVVPILSADQHTISYDVANGDSYLGKLVASAQIANTNPNVFSENTPLNLKNLSVAGYRFLGWYDGAGSNAQQIRVIDGIRYDLELYAHWEKINYRVQFKSSLFLDTDETTYTVDTGVVLPTPKLSNYNFIVWSDEEGNVYNGNTIPVGTTGNLTLQANWTSERNKTFTKPTLDNPIVYVDELTNTILFAYEIGEVQNVPLYTIKDFGYISGDGVTKSATEKYSMQISETAMEAYTNSVAKATTESSSWALSSDWNKTTSVDESWCQENDMTVQEAESIAKNQSSNWNVSSGKNGSFGVTTGRTTENGWENNVKVTNSSSQSHTDTKNNKVNINGKLTYTPRTQSLGLGFKGAEISASSGGGWGGEIGGGYEHSWGTEDTTTHSTGVELGGSQSHNVATSASASLNSGWNTSASFGGSSSVTSTQSSMRQLSEKISNEKHYGESYAEGGSSSETQGVSSMQSAEDEYSNSVTWSSTTQNEVESSWTTQATKPGYHRWVVAGTAHVFGVVGFNMATQSYFVYTYSIMDEETHEFEDYSYTTAAYNDEENGVIPFNVPYEVAEYVSRYTCASEGLEINQSTGIITKYTGTDTCVVIPEYMNVGGGDVVKVRGISSQAFQGNKHIMIVVLSDFIEEIPDGAFKGCSNLLAVQGGSVTRIGREAFAGCTGVEDLGLRSNLTYLGDNAFTGVHRVLANIGSTKEEGTCNDVLSAVVNSGAEQIIINLSELPNGTEDVEGKTIAVPARTEYFEFNGAGKTYRNFAVSSEAGITVINKTNFDCTGKIALQTTSPEVVLNQSDVTTNGIGVIFKADHTNLGLQDTIEVTSSGEYALLTKALRLYQANDKVASRLVVSPKILVCGEVENENEYLTYDVYEKIGPERFEQLCNSYTIFFDAKGGICDEQSRQVPNGTAVGTLPVPSKEFFSFAGWYTADGIQVSADYQSSSGMDMTVYARWNANAYTVSWDSGTGYTISVVRTFSPYAGADAESLSSGGVVYYGDELHVTYRALNGYSLTSQGATEVTVTGNVNSNTIYTVAKANNYTYNVVYKSINGTNLGSTTVTYAFDTTNSISAPAKTGYVTPSPQSVKWDSTSKTITFVYDVSPVGYTNMSGTIGEQFSYSAQLQYQNRTATSVQVRVVWTTTIYAYNYNVYGQQVNTSTNAGSSSAQVAAFRTWANNSSSPRSSTGTTGWMTVNLGTTNATTASVSYYYYQFNSNGTNMYTYDGTPHAEGTWSMNIPAY